jgi:crotonobetainyl-CoA:carnitine CoA-transferase CaiB-like acyl-CoA transferase
MDDAGDAVKVTPTRNTGPRRGPLHDIRIVDFTENMAGPFGTMILADQGADVIKVESTSGDIIRQTGSGSHEMASYFANLNRSKRSISINLHKPESAQVLEALLDTADVVVHSFRPSATQRMGLEAKNVLRHRPELIYVSIVGFGTTGPMAGRPVYDHVIQALSGMADLQRDSDDDVPHLIRHGLIDKSTGYVLAESVCAALIARYRSGVGTTLSISMLDVAISLLWPDAMMDRTALEPELRRPSAAQTFRLTKTADGYVSLVVIKQAQWDGLVAALDVDLKFKGYTASNDDSSSPGEVLRAARKIIAELPTDDVVARLSKFDVPCAPVKTLDQMIVDEQVVANETLIEYEHPLIGPIRQPRPSPRFSSMEGASLLPAPGLGDQSREILTELGVSDLAIDELIASGTVRAGKSRTERTIHGK